MKIGVFFSNWLVDWLKCLVLGLKRNFYFGGRIRDILSKVDMIFFLGIYWELFKV